MEKHTQEKKKIEKKLYHQPQFKKMGDVKKLTLGGVIVPNDDSGPAFLNS